MIQRRRSLGSGRRLAVIGSVVLLAGSVLPWYTIGGGDGQLSAETFRAFDGTGILAFIAAIATLALVSLPYAAGRPIAVDRGLAYGALAIAALGGILLWIPEVLGDLGGLLPDRAPGFWIALVGAVILGRAAFEVATERPRP